MSYPDLGCFSECLECELCDDGFDLLDLDIPYDFFDDGIPDWADPNWGPPDIPESDPFDPWGIQW